MIEKLEQFEISSLFKFSAPHAFYVEDKDSELERVYSIQKTAELIPSKRI
jgi:hypothetical protein